MLNNLKDKIIFLMKNDVKKILQSVRNEENLVGDRIAFLNKNDGTPVTQADIKIGKLFVEELKKMLPESIVINEEDFNLDVFEHLQEHKYVWVVDPIDGTRAFCDINNKKYCVAVALLEDMKPVLSVIYIPEFEIGGNTDFIIYAIDSEDGIKVAGKQYQVVNEPKISNIKYVCHTQNDDELSDLENYIGQNYGDVEKIKSNFGHSTLINYALVATSGLKRAFSKRKVNIWDIAQSAYIVEKAGGKVFYEDGTDVFPLDIKRCKFEDNKLTLPFTIAGNSELRSILKKRSKND